ncbi:MAG: hypothetical protein KAR44_04580 [Candidatus Aegiribacteria sp.]|nr:hypothetical protein [Candidatus Aegiribacteria sp.]
MRFVKLTVAVLFVVFSLMVISGSSKGPDGKYNTDYVEIESSILFTLGENRAGIYECNATLENVEELAALYGEVEIEEVDRMTEGMSNPILELTFEDDTSKTLVLELIETDHSIWRIWRIGVFSDRFMTEEGVGIGSTYEDIENNYLIDGVFWGETGDPCVVVGAPHMSFILEQGDWWQMGEVVGEIPGETEIISILVVGN